MLDHTENKRRLEEKREGIPNTFLSMLLSPANMSIKSSADASELISLISIKPNFALDIWTVNKSGFKSNDRLMKFHYD